MDNDLEIDRDIETEAQEECPESEDENGHCNCWWESGGRCCYCGAEAQLEE